MLLEQIELTNLLSFGSSAGPIQLGDLNVLIGPNGSGKSNLIEAISLLRSAPAELVVPVREGGGVRDWIWRGASRAAKAGVDVVVPYPAGPHTLRYRLSF